MIYFSLQNLSLSVTLSLSVLCVVYLKSVSVTFSLLCVIYFSLQNMSLSVTLSLSVLCVVCLKSVSVTFVVLCVICFSIQNLSVTLSVLRVQGLLKIRLRHSQCFYCAVYFSVQTQLLSIHHCSLTTTVPPPVLQATLP